MPDADWIVTSVNAASTFSIAVAVTPIWATMANAMMKPTCRKLCCTLTGQPMRRIAAIPRQSGGRANSPRTRRASRSCRASPPSVANVTAAPAPAVPNDGSDHKAEHQWPGDRDL